MSSSINSIRTFEPSFSSSSVGLNLQEKKNPSKSSQNTFLSQVSIQFSKQNIPGAIDAFFRFLTFVSKEDSKEDLDEAYRFTFCLLEQFTSDNLKHLERVGVLDAFLGASKDMKKNQGKLCYLLGERHEKNTRDEIEKKQKSNIDYVLRELINSYSSSLLYYSKAISIVHGDDQADSFFLKNVFEKTSLIFVEIIKCRLQESFSKAIRESNPESFQEILAQIDLLERFCSSKSQIDSIYNTAADRVFGITNLKVQEKFECVKEKIRNLYTQDPKISQKNLAQHYRDSLTEFRQNFSKDIEDVSVFQIRLAEKFKRFFQEVFLKDSFTILGPPPCGYDVRAMGSIGKRELCPYSDLEYFILMEEDTPPAREYLKNFAALLRLQLILLDETPDLMIVFKSLHDKNTSGFKVDGGGDPSKDERLINTPLQMAQVIKKGVSHPGDIENTLLKSMSLACTDDKLFLSYQTLLKDYLDESDESVLGSIPKRQEIGLNLIKERLREYRQSSPINFQLLQKPVNIKETFLEFIPHLIRDLSIYFACSVVNTHDIVDSLVDKRVFTPLSGLLIKESLSNLYKIRIRLHQDSRCQYELWDPLEQLDNQMLEAEKHHLEKIYWLVLRPLYFSIGKALQNEGDFEKAFQGVDLIQEGFTSLLQENGRKELAPFIRLSVEYLIQSGAQDSLHLQFYRYLSSLSDTENLRKAYLGALEGANAELVNTLADIPALDGFRLSYARKEKELQNAIEALTTEEDTGVQIQWGNQKKPQFLKQSCIDQILDEKGDIKNSYESSMHRVAKTSGSASLHFKQFPSHPLMEYAVGNLYARVAGLLTPAVDLACFTVKSREGVRRYPVLISQTIEGKNLKELLGSKPSSLGLLDRVNWESWSWMLLCSILSLPGDGRLPNYILDSQNNIWCIDNDISFVEPVVQEMFGRKKINFCSALFCLFQTKPLSQKTLENFCSFDTGVLLNSWLLDVIKKDKECQALFKKEEKKLWLEQANSSKSTILLKEGAVANLNLQFWRLQVYIKSSLQKKQAITPLDLLSQIISLRKNRTLENPTGLFIRSIYEHHTQKKLSIDQLLSKIVDRSTEQSLTSFQSDMVCFERPPTIKEVEERSLFSPERARDELLITMISQVFSEEHDLVYTGNRNKTEVLQGNFKEVSLERQKIIVLSLSHFVALSSKKPKVVILQHCDALDSTNLSLFLHKDLEYLDIRFCKKIKGPDFELIARLCPHLKELRVMSGPEIKNIKNGAVFNSNVVFSELEVLKISNCENLVNIYIEAPHLKTCVLRDNPKLSWVNCSGISPVKINFGWSKKLTQHVLGEIFKQDGISNYDLKIARKEIFSVIWVYFCGDPQDPSFQEKFEFLINNGFIFEGNDEFENVIDAFLSSSNCDTFQKIIESYPQVSSYKEVLTKKIEIILKLENFQTLRFLLSKSSLFNAEIEWHEIVTDKSIEFETLSFFKRNLERLSINLEIVAVKAFDKAISLRNKDILEFLLEKAKNFSRETLEKAIDDIFLASIWSRKKTDLEFFLERSKAFELPNLERSLGRALASAIYFGFEPITELLSVKIEALGIAQIEDVAGKALVETIHFENNKALKILPSHDLNNASRKIITSLLERIESIDARGEWISSALGEAAKTKYWGVVNFLIQESQLRMSTDGLLNALHVVLESKDRSLIAPILDKIISRHKKLRSQIVTEGDSLSSEEKNEDVFIWDGLSVRFLMRIGNYFFKEGDYQFYRKLEQFLLKNRDEEDRYHIKAWAKSCIDIP